MHLYDDARAMEDDLAHCRRQLHGWPEVGLELPRTQATVLGELQGLDLELTTGTACSSVTAVLRGRGGDRPVEAPRTVLLRADMDALPIQERTGLDFAATNGAMHACGHDVHTAALIGAARLLHAHRDRVHGDVVLMFQPGEEADDGAAIMVGEGVLDAAGRRIDAAFALHVLSSTVDSGLVAGRPGALTSSAHHLRILVRGEGGHGSQPHLAKDPVTAAAATVTALQTMVTRCFDIFDPVVVTVGMIRAGSLPNVIPAEVELGATVRCFSEAAQRRLESVIPETIQHVALAHGVTSDVHFLPGPPSVINDVDETAFAADVVRETLGEQHYLELPQPIAGSEDFSRVLAEVPGAMLAVGAVPRGLDVATAPNNHSPHADFDPTALPRAAALYAGLAIGRLSRLETA